MRTPVVASLVASSLLALTAALLPATGAGAEPAVPVGSGASAVGPTAPMTAYPSPVTARAPRPFPALQVTTLADGLDHAWDVQELPGGGLLVSERDRARLSIVDDGGTRTLDFPSDRVWVSGETGLMGLAVDPGFEDNRRFYTCQGSNAAGDRHDVRVVAWRLGQDGTTVGGADVLLKGIQATSGRHGGCRLLVTDRGALLVGTGDAAVGANPQDRTSLNGKVLRLDPRTGRPSAANPWAGSENRKKRYVLTYGHRNVQGLAQRADGSLWSVEHGSYRDDEVNLLRRGANYGWDPRPGYDESVPMTDFSLPGKQRAARWRSGNPTIAPSGATFIRGAAWGRYRGRLAVAVLGGTRMMFQAYDGKGRLTDVRVPPVLREQGRLRSVTQLADGALVVTTDNGGGADRVLRVEPVRG
ncbi:Aldose sugar dehydrogenase YliI [Nocardioides aquaticus]|uniref:Aldose sugar dehydrogenase YliI n=1 Tax=Nocardioides aquaticus TaxID=160826 RepID=A0ABX8EJY8_9ACTN|nr:PQQ-dependent sugar dehydrogenase [Nocardioides aquaticus]QVT80230.1 Aldose sugar dehydrogenase YliI [Nocardioides aquaticus]